jgi:hypothetical protein
MRIIIAGSRWFNNYELLKRKMDAILTTTPLPITIISGTCQGADKLGEQYAKEKGYEVEQHPADWDRFGRAAGPIRNEEMAKVADACVVFWNGKTPGSKSMVALAKKYKLKLREVLY